MNCLNSLTTSSKNELPFAVRQSCHGQYARRSRFFSSSGASFRRRLSSVGRGKWMIMERSSTCRKAILLFRLGSSFPSKGHYDQAGVGRATFQRRFSPAGTARQYLSLHAGDSSLLEELGKVEFRSERGSSHRAGRGKRRPATPDSHRCRCGFINPLLLALLQEHAALVYASNLLSIECSGIIGAAFYAEGLALG